MITLHIQLLSKPEMTATEATQHIDKGFPATDKPALISCDAVLGIVRLKLNQDELTDAQRDWLHLTPFAADYIDSYTVQKEKNAFTEDELQQLVALLNEHPFYMNGRQVTVTVEDRDSYGAFRIVMETERYEMEFSFPVQKA